MQCFPFEMFFFIFLVTILYYIFCQWHSCLKIVKCNFCFLCTFPCAISSCIVIYYASFMWSTRAGGTSGAATPPLRIAIACPTIFGGVAEQWLLKCKLCPTSFIVLPLALSILKWSQYFRLISAKLLCTYVEYLLWLNKNRF